MPIIITNSSLYNNSQTLSDTIKYLIAVLHHTNPCYYFFLGGGTHVWEINDYIDI